MEDFVPEDFLQELQDGADDADAQPTVHLFCMATYGEGEPTDNAQAFTEWLQGVAESDPADGNEDHANAKKALAHLRFCVFGLGNRQYEHFNKMGKDTASRLEACGGTPAAPYGEGDDDGTLEDDFEKWKDGLWPALVESMGLGADPGAAADGAGPQLAPLPPLEFNLEWLPVGWEPSDATSGGSAGAGGAGGDSRRRGSSAADVDLSSRGYFLARDVKVVENRELRGSGPGSTRHVELDLRGTDITYQTAGNAVVCPENDGELVDALIRWLGYDPDRAFDLTPVDGGNKALFPTPCTVREALLRYCDINSVPRKPLVGSLAHFVTEPREKERLLRLTSKEGREEYHEWVVEHRRSFAEVVQTLPSLKVPFGRLVEMLPRLQPRYYTISSSSAVHPERVHITVSVVREQKPRASGDPERLFLGVCSNYLDRMQPPATGADGKRVDGASKKSKKGERRAAWPTVKLFIKPSSFRLPDDPSIPVIMVGPGTGIAPMRAFLQERDQQRASGAPVGPTVLFFGCRKRSEDYIYEDELLAYARDGTLTELHHAFSREQAEKVYVQHRVTEHGARVWELMQAGGHFYVCGGIKMGNDVSAALAQVAVEHGGMTAEAGKAWVRELQEKHRYVAELWS